MKDRVNDHSSSILSKLLMTLQSTARASRHLPFYAGMFQSTVSLLLQNWDTHHHCSNFSVSTIYLGGGPELHNVFTNTGKCITDTVVRFPIPLLIIPNTAFLALMNLCFHRAINTQGLSSENLEATHSFTVYTNKRLIFCFSHVHCLYYINFCLSFYFQSINIKDPSEILHGLPLSILPWTI